MRPSGFDPGIVLAAKAPAMPSPIPARRRDHLLGDGVAPNGDWPSADGITAVMALDGFCRIDQHRLAWILFSAVGFRTSSSYRSPRRHGRR